MSGLYANRSLQANLDALGPIERYPRVGVAGAEFKLTLAVATGPGGHVQAFLCLDLVVPGDHVLHSIPLGIYSYGMMDLAHADAMLVSLRLDVDLREADPSWGWKVMAVPSAPAVKNGDVIDPTD